MAARKTAPKKKKQKKTLVVVRRAAQADLHAAGALGAALARAHHAWDSERFFLWDDMESGYARWLGKELKNKDAVVLVAEVDGALAAYAYGTKAPRDWSSLREACGIAVDLYVDPKHRKHGVGNALVDALTALGARFVILQVAANNKTAQRFFKAGGFRPTMIEMMKSRRVSR